MNNSLYLYPLWLRLWHWLNAVLCLLLIITGISLQYSDPDFPLMRFDLAVSIHNIAGFLLTVSYLFFIPANIVSKNNRFYKINSHEASGGFMNELILQFKYYTRGMFLKQKAPFPVCEQRKFNPLQKLSYLIVLYVFMPIIIITGWGLLFPEITISQFLGISGLHITNFLHLIVGFFISLFLLIHIYFSTIGPTNWSHFKAMITGWHQKH